MIPEEIILWISFEVHVRIVVLYIDVLDVGTVREPMTMTGPSVIPCTGPVGCTTVFSLCGVDN